LSSAAKRNRCQPVMSAMFAPTKGFRAAVGMDLVFFRDFE
jgi:hypothetical protein